MRRGQPNAAPTAIFCANDQMAAGCYEALRRLELDIPADVSVIGYDNQPVSRILDPPLTTLDLPHAEMGRWAAEQLLGTMVAAKTVRLECRLIERQSVAHAISP
jgi:LacI family transcriptional regulator